MSYTPGPWWVIAQFDDMDVFVSAGPNGGQVCSCQEHPMIDRNTAVANARLIAAAPDLLAACKEFVRKVDAGEARSTRSYAQMKLAIAKTEGL